MGPRRRRPRRVRELHTKANRLSWFNPSTAHHSFGCSDAISQTLHWGSWARYGPNQIDCLNMRRLFQAKESHGSDTLVELSKRSGDRMNGPPDATYPTGSLSTSLFLSVT